MTMHNEETHENTTGHQRSNHINSLPINNSDHIGQHTSVNRPALKKITAEPQKHTCHEKILSIQINDTQKSTYNAKVGNTEAMALFDSGMMLSCISKQFYDCICQLEPTMVINTTAGPPIVIMSASAEELINLGQCRLHIKLGPTFEYYFQIIKNLK